MEQETTTILEFETTETQTQTYDDTELLAYLENLKAQSAEIQVGINYTNSLLYEQTNDIEMIRGCILFTLCFTAIIFIYKFLRYIF